MLKIYRNTNLFVVSFWQRKLVSQTEEDMLRVFVNRILRMVSGVKENEVTVEWENYVAKSFMISIPQQVLSGRSN
jgi:hypothetical protein